MKWFYAVIIAALITDCSGNEPPACIVRDGKPAAEIVITPERPRMVTLAALELRHYIEKMSGARLPVVTGPGTNYPLKIYVGKSKYTDKLGISDEGLRDGAFRIVSGPDWLVLIGKDYDFDYSGLPWPLKRDDIPRAAAEWEKATQGKTDSAWEFPFFARFKGFWNPKNFDEIMSKQYGDDFSALWKKEESAPAGFWNEDESGSFNAVCEFLRRLGVRWYMAGDIGEVVPNKASIFIEPCNETVKPDLPLRMYFWYNYSMFSFDDVIWARRLGMNSGHEQLGPARSGLYGAVKPAAGELPDGRVFIVCNSPNRRNMYITVSRDGRLFDKTWLLMHRQLNDFTPGAMKNQGGPGAGPQYFKQAVVGQSLWLVYSISKEHIGATRVPVTALE